MKNFDEMVTEAVNAYGTIGNSSAPSDARTMLKTLPKLMKVLKELGSKPIPYIEKELRKSYPDTKINKIVQSNMNFARGGRLNIIFKVQFDDPHGDSKSGKTVGTVVAAFDLGSGNMNDWDFTGTG